MRKSSKFTSAFKAKVAMEAIRESATMAELGQALCRKPRWGFQLPLYLIAAWKEEFVAGQAFEKPVTQDKEIRAPRG